MFPGRSLGTMQPTSPASPESSRSAYRSAANPADGASSEPDEAFREHLHPVLVLVGLASVARVVGAVYCREVIGAEATLALMTIVAVVWYALAVHKRGRELGSPGPREPRECFERAEQ
jgi:hypothetical protein